MKYRSKIDIFASILALASEDGIRLNQINVPHLYILRTNKEFFETFNR